MAKIIYGISGQGFGHAARSHEVLDHLKEMGHEILVFTYGQALFLLEKDFKVVEIPGLGLYYKDNKLVYWRTFFQNAQKMASQSKNWLKLNKIFKEFGPDVVITDFEPMSALMAKTEKVPLISLDNQHQITNAKIKLPWRYTRDLMADKVVIKSMVWGADSYLVTSFFETPIKKKNTFVFPPIVRREIMALEPKKEDYFLVYQNSEFDHIVEVLKNYPNFKFVVFLGDHKEGVDGNVEFKKYSQEDWLKYLANCKGIIATAGLSLISEALYLSKPYLAVPLKKQVEQVINAEYLQKMGYGLYQLDFTKDGFDKFVAKLPELERNLSQYDRKDNSAIFAKLDELVGKFTGK